MNNLANNGAKTPRSKVLILGATGGTGRLIVDQARQPLSPCDQRGTMQPSIGMQLIQDERRNVCSRYASVMEA
jgi:hypothetical protein